MKSRKRLVEASGPWGLPCVISKLKSASSLQRCAGLTCSCSTASKQRGLAILIILECKKCARNSRQKVCNSSWQRGIVGL